MRLYLLTSPFRLFYKPFHNLGVFARMNCQHSTIQKVAVLLSDCLVLILWVNVLEDLLGSQRLSIVVVALDPESRSEVVFIVWNINVVFSKLFFLLLYILISRDLNETELILLFTLVYLLLGQLFNTLTRSCWTIQILFVQISESLAGLNCLLPFPTKVC